MSPFGIPPPPPPPTIGVGNPDVGVVEVVGSPVGVGNGEGLPELAAVLRQTAVLGFKFRSRTYTNKIHHYKKVHFEYIFKSDSISP